MHQIINSIIGWMKKVPADKPQDLQVFEDSQQKLRDSSYRMIDFSNEIDRFVRRIHADKVFKNGATK